MLLNEVDQQNKTQQKMEALSKLQTLIMQPLEAWPLLQEKGQLVIELVQSRPWAALGAATGTVLLWKLIKAPRNLPPGQYIYNIYKNQYQSIKLH